MAEDVEELVGDVAAVGLVAGGEGGTGDEPDPAGALGQVSITVSIKTTLDPLKGLDG